MVQIVKASGEKQEFDRNKIVATVIHAGGDKALAERVANEVERQVRDGMKTSDVLKIALRILDKYKPHVAARYDLKSAIMRLGPAGFAFEALIAELLQQYGWKAQTDTIFRGKCVQHEVDVAATRKDEIAMFELKYHNAPGIFTGIRDALYVYARFLDLKEGGKMGRCPKFNQGWLVTNTKFSVDTLEYANCSGLNLLGWKYPKDNSLQKMLEAKKLYPMRTADSDTLGKLSEAQMLFCKDLLEHGIEELQNMTGISPRKLRQLQEEARLVCG